MSTPLPPSSPGQSPPASAGRDGRGRDIWPVSRLVREARAVVEGAFPLLWVEGELSNLSRPRSGHWYFTLKDPAAQVRCAMFRNRNMTLRMVPREGMQVLLRVRVSLYEARGDFQLIAEDMEEAGDGALRRRFEELKAKLAAEGLFDAGRKRTLPPIPRCVGVMTSVSGAAIHDVLNVLGRRFPAVPVVVYPVPVQGNDSPRRMTRMLDVIEQRAEVSVLLVVRGGGSLEDLAAFNDETLARRIAALSIPVVSGVGHEVDFTIADFVADLRAPTPSAAAEAVVPDRVELINRYQALVRRLGFQARQRVARGGERWLRAAARLRRVHPMRRIEARAQRLDELERRLLRMQVRTFDLMEQRLRAVSARLLRQHPGRRLVQRHERVRALSRRLARSGPARDLPALGSLVAERHRRLRRVAVALLGARRNHFYAIAQHLDAVSPLAVLGRGYAIISRDDGSVVERAADLTAGDRVTARLREGEARLCVEDTRVGPSDLGKADEK
ncbi:MAG: exodeoxyribonuclease VII large subunit [Gammaproteobacteria bacterium]